MANQAKGTCGSCRYFADDPVELERAVPGLNILSSAFGSVRDETGLCALREAFVTPSAGCADFSEIRAESGNSQAG